MNIPGKHILGNAFVSSDAIVRENAVVCDTAWVHGDAVILGGTWNGSEGEINTGRWIAPGIPADVEFESISTPGFVYQLKAGG